MYLMQHRNLHVLEDRVFAEVIERCIHHFFWDRRADIGLVRPSTPCAPCSGGHPVEESWVIFHRAPALEGDLTCYLQLEAFANSKFTSKQLLWSVCLQPQEVTSAQVTGSLSFLPCPRLWFLWPLCPR